MLRNVKCISHMPRCPDDTLTNWSNRSMKKPAKKVRRGVACMWKLYGCPEINVVDQASHDALCDFFCDQEVDRCWAQLRQHEKMNEIPDGLWNLFAATARKFKTLSLSTAISGISPPLKTSPIIFDPLPCWADSSPSSADVDRYGMSGVRPPNSQSLQAAKQLRDANHKPAEVVYVLSLTPPYILTKYPLRLPGWLSNQWTDAEGGVLMDATPKFTCLDVHCDRGLSTISIPLGAMVTLWLIWPGNDQNNKLFDECIRGGGTRVQQISMGLTEGIIAITDHTQAMYLPSGYLSLTYMLVGGYMTGISFSGREDLPSFVECVERELKYETDVQDLKSTITFLLATMERSLMSNDPAVIYNTACLWIRVMQAMKNATTTRGLKWLGMPRAIHQTLIRCRNGNKTIVEQGCPCGQVVRGPFFKHFVTHRLSK